MKSLSPRITWAINRTRYKKITTEMKQPAQT